MKNTSSQLDKTNASSSTTVASSSHGTSSSLVISNITNLVPIKLNGTNYLMWKSLFEPILRGHRLISFVDGTKSAPPPESPEYSEWYEKDQMLLSWFNATLSLSVLPYVVGLRSAKEAWDVLARRYGTTSPAHVMNLRHALHNIKKGSSQSMQEYLQQFKVVVDQLGASGSVVSNDEFFFVLLNGLPPAYSSISAIIRYRAQSASITREEAESLLLSEDLALQRQAHSVDISALSARFLHQPRGRGQPAHHRNQGRYSNHPRMEQNPRGAANWSRSRNNTCQPQKNNVPQNSSYTDIPLSEIICQICDRRGHRAIDCYQRMNFTYQGRHPPEKLAAMAASSFMDDSTSYTDHHTGATHHITSDLGDLPISSNYDGSDSTVRGLGNGEGQSHGGDRDTQSRDV